MKLRKMRLRVRWIRGNIFNPNKFLKMREWKIVPHGKVVGWFQPCIYIVKLEK